MEQILEDKKKGYPDTLKKLRSKYDFDELKKDAVAKAYLDFNVGSWVIDGEDKLLTTDPAKWEVTYDAAVKVKAAKAGVDVTKNVASGIAARNRAPPDGSQWRGAPRLVLRVSPCRRRTVAVPAAEDPADRRTRPGQ